MAKTLRHPFIPVYQAAVIVPQQGSDESGYTDLTHGHTEEAGPDGGGHRVLKLVMAYIPSSISLMDALRAARGGLPEGAVQAVMVQLVSVLEHLHQNGVVYVVRQGGVAWVVHQGGEAWVACQGEVRGGMVCLGEEVQATPSDWALGVLLGTYHSFPPCFPPAGLETGEPPCV